MFEEVFKVKSILLAATFCVISSQVASSKEKLSRSEKDAILIFKEIILSDKDNYSRCTISDKWLIYQISANTIRKFTKYPADNNLSPPKHDKNPKDIIVGNNEAESLICSEKERADIKDNALSVSTHTDNGTFKGHKIIASIQTLLSKFSYPIFDKKYKIAFLVQDSSSRIWIKTDDNKYPSFGDGEVAVLIYKKKRGKWKLIGREIYATYS
ncbi:hypothetical protein [Methylobacterium sp. SyP6R]|uniref:hypothetical protein n=1 Tax=Methylobacterium sp. SyP6R TaxID=2718876 RepID=UPI001F2D5C6A|nr:hypothetical protein [Methylobacterium sp. SyP6R]MCF4130291.1 hypothetical protein [Methylobacterium sp. SyP6R]